jgi:hypothetical protein
LKESLFGTKLQLSDKLQFVVAGQTSWRALLCNVDKLRFIEHLLWRLSWPGGFRIEENLFRGIIKHFQMYKFIVSCYYWPATEGRLRLRSLQIRSNRRSSEKSLDYSQVARLISVDNTSSSTERRRAPRFKAGCDAEVTANLAILDIDAPSVDDLLLFMGRTTDLSAGGVALVLPSTVIDERYCGESARLHLLLHLPTGTVSLDISPVRCEPITVRDTSTAYFIGAKILSIDDNRDEYDSYLRSITDVHQ